ncbi:MAG TPA: CvpA family protein, partial [Nitratifractor sp.]|nr:CvpA family protein [Nitratifractor sp.]
VMGINIVDLVVVLLILLLSIKGLMNGFTKELLSAIGLIGGLFAATYFSGQLSEFIYSNLTDALSMNLLKVISTVLIFIVVWYVANLIGKGIALTGNSEYLSTTSRLAGMFIKMLALFFIFSLITFALSTKPQVAERFKDTLDKSKLYPLLKNTGAAILNMSDVALQHQTSELNNTESNATQTAVAVEQNSVESNASQVETNTTK